MSTDVVSAQPARPAKAAGNALYETLKTRIIEGQLRAGDALPSTRTAMRMYDVSYRAAVQAVRRLESEGLVICRPGSGAYVREVAEYVKLKADTKVVHVIATHTCEFAAIVHRPLIEAIEKQLAAMRCTYFVEEHPALDEACDAIRQKRADALIWVVPSIPTNLRVPDGPVVIVAQDAEVASPKATGYDIVTADSRQGGALAAQYLRQAGCRTPAVLAAYGNVALRHDAVSLMRIHGFEVGWGEPIPAASIVWTGHYMINDGASKVVDFLSMSPRPDGVFAVSDDLARGLSMGLVAHGMKLGRDLKVIGFDAQPSSSTREVALTTVRVPFDELGRAAALQAIQRASDPEGPMRRISFGCSIQVGATG